MLKTCNRILIYVVVKHFKTSRPFMYSFKHNWVWRYLPNKKFRPRFFYKNVQCGLPWSLGQQCWLKYGALGANFYLTTQHVFYNIICFYINVECGLFLLSFSRTNFTSFYVYKLWKHLKVCSKLERLLTEEILPNFCVAL